MKNEMNFPSFPPFFPSIPVANTMCVCCSNGPSPYRSLCGIDMPLAFTQGQFKSLMSLHSPVLFRFGSPSFLASFHHLQYLSAWSVTLTRLVTILPMPHANFPHPHTAIYPAVRGDTIRPNDMISHWHLRHHAPFSPSSYHCFARQYVETQSAPMTL